MSVNELATPTILSTRNEPAANNGRPMAVCGSGDQQGSPAGRDMRGTEAPAARQIPMTAPELRTGWATPPFHFHEHTKAS